MYSDSMGWKAFAGIMIMVAGSFNIIDGLIGITRTSYFESTLGTTELPIVNNIHTWSWVVLGAGIVLAAAGIAIFYGSLWARVVGIIAASVNMIIQFTYIAHYPFWSLSMVVLDAFVIYALAMHRAPASATTGFMAAEGDVSLDLSRSPDPRSASSVPGAGIGSTR